MMIKKFLYFIFFFLSVFQSKAQSEIDTLLMGGGEVDSMVYYENRLQTFSLSIIRGTSFDERSTATYQFARNLVAALKQPNSYKYPFDSVKKFISVIESPDRKFRIFTWNLKYDNDSFAFYGAIQMNEDPLKLYGLYDKSGKMDGEKELEISDNKNWYGALYYDIIRTKYKRKIYYTLLGWDGYDRSANRKVIDVLTFDEYKMPVFGAPIFEKEDGVYVNRVIFEMNNQASMTLHYDKKEKRLDYEHLIPPTPQLEGVYDTYVPDGSYDYFKFKKGVWKKYIMLYKGIRSPNLEE